MESIDDAGMRGNYGTGHVVHSRLREVLALAGASKLGYSFLMCGKGQGSKMVSSQHQQLQNYVKTREQIRVSYTTKFTCFDKKR